MERIAKSYLKKAVARFKSVRNKNFEIKLIEKITKNKKQIKKIYFNLGR